MKVNADYIENLHVRDVEWSMMHDGVAPLNVVFV